MVSGGSECLRPQTLSHHPSEVADSPLVVRGHEVRIIAEIALDKRPMSKAQVIWLGTMAKLGLGEDLSDVKWPEYSLNVSVKGPRPPSRPSFPPVGQRVTFIATGYAQ